ncbi:MAG: hypothetical protein R3D51_00510 [Hyphomicrobiaceae bacterium]
MIDECRFAGQILARPFAIAAPEIVNIHQIGSIASVSKFGLDKEPHVIGHR